MELKEFHNALSIMRSIDRVDLENVGLIEKGDHNQWGEFRRNPYTWFIRVSDSKSLKLWDIIQRRLKE